MQKKGWIGIKNETPNYRFIQELGAKLKDKDLKGFQNLSGLEKDTNTFYEEELKYLFYDTLNNPRESQSNRAYSEKFECEIPFLNGGLFEADYDWKNEPLNIPDSFFVKVLDSFDRFNFTIIEDDPDEKIIALNPEILGYTFEKILKGKNGTFYTQSVEAQFMAKESLYQFLLNKNFGTSSIGKFKLRKLVYNEPFNFENELEKQSFKTEFLQNFGTIISQFTVLDLACGSGSILMSMLQVLHKFYFNLYQIFEVKFESFKIKLRIIEDNLFGADINEEAVEIAKLRFWLTLAVDSEEIEISKIKPLPNLKFKLVVGDSLNCGDFDKNWFEVHQFQLFSQKDDLVNDLAIKIQSHVESYGSAKEKLESEIQELQSQLFKDIDLKENDYKNSVLFPLHFPFEFVSVNKGFAVIIANPPYVRQEGIKNKDELIKSVQTWISPIYKPQKKSDLYVYFYFRAMYLLQKNGILTFICSNSWLDVGYGSWLQQYFLQNSKIKFIIDNSSKRSFKNASINTIINVIQKTSFKELGVDYKAKFLSFTKSFEECLDAENLNAIDKIDSSQTSFLSVPFEFAKLRAISQKKILSDAGERVLSKQQFKYNGEKWGGKFLRAPEIYYTVLQKGKDKLVKLGDIADVRRGFTTGANDFFYLTKENAEEWGIEKEFLKPVIKSPKECKSILINPDDLNFRVFMCHKPKNELIGTNALKYIEWGEKNEFHKRPSVQIRRNWYDLGSWTRYDIFWMETINDINRVYLNIDKKLFESDKFYGISFYNKNLMNSYLQLLNSTLVSLLRENLGFAGLGDGALKLPVFEVKLILVPNFQIDENLKLTRPIKSIFEECGFDSNLQKCDLSKAMPDRLELDKIVFDALELSEEERQAVYDETCRLVWNRINKAKSV